MEYKYAKNDNYEDYASGRVIYHVGGEPTFPVRLSLEIYERCLQYSNKSKDIILYDCCCGGAYMLTIIGLLKSATLAKIYASDVNEESINLAKNNLALLTSDGLNKRKAELEALYAAFKKTSHLEAINSIDKLKQQLESEIEATVFAHNVFKTFGLSFVPDIIITDVPYGNMVDWCEGDGGVNQMLEALFSACGPDTILCICMDKKQKIQTDHFERLEKQLIGKRKFEIYKMK